MERRSSTPNDVRAVRWSTIPASGRKRIAGGGERDRILALVDDLSLGDELQRSFGETGFFSFLRCENCGQALAAVKSWAPDLVVFSSGLSNIPARQLAAEIQDLPMERPPLLLMISDRTRAAHLDLDEISYDAHLLLPVVPEQLVTTVEALLDAQRDVPHVEVETLVRTFGFHERRTVDIEEAPMAAAISISEIAIVLEAKYPFRLGAQGRLQFFLPDSDHGILAKGVARALLDELLLRYLVDFTQISASHLKLIRKYIAESGRQKPA